MSKEKLIGTWKLISAEYRRADGIAIDYLGDKPVGQLVYEARGNVSIQLMRRERPAFAVNDRAGSTPQEAKAALDGYLAYFGTYDVNETQGTVTHHITGCAFPNWVGVDQTRYFELAGNRLTLRTPALMIQGAQVNGQLVWERAG